jgi:hypothetical protein
MKQNQLNTAAQWVRVDDTSQWDAWLARLGGHPLQSRLWGEARLAAEGIEYECLAVFDPEGIVQALARVEARKVPLLGSFAWMPKGPVCSEAFDPWSGLEEALRTLGFAGWAASPWEAVAAEAVPVPGPRTIWLDLTRGWDALLQDMDSQFRYGARRALRDGLLVSSTVSEAQARAFHGLCLAISARKGFDLPASEALMQQLLLQSRSGGPVEARLFVATSQDSLVGGAFILRAGKHVHYLWGAVDRAHARARAGEALQCAVIEWALAQQCTLYDLEGIDPINNAGTYQFKKKVGGSEVQLRAQREQALDWRGSLLLQAMRIKRRLARPAQAAPAAES